MSESFVNPVKQQKLDRRMSALGIKESELLEKFILGSGKGGQKINKTASCVYLKHIPSGIEIKCQAERSRALNRFLARRELCARLEERVLGKLSERQQLMEKIRRQKRRRSRRQKERMLDDKHKHSVKKELRKRAGYDE